MRFGRTYVCIHRKPFQGSRPLIAGNPVTPVHLGFEVQLYSDVLETSEETLDYLHIVGYRGEDRQLRRVSELVGPDMRGPYVPAIKLQNIFLN